MFHPTFKLHCIILTTYMLHDICFLRQYIHLSLSSSIYPMAIHQNQATVTVLSPQHSLHYTVKDVLTSKPSYYSTIRLK